MSHKVTIVDYGMGNLWSVASAFHYLGADYSISSDPKEISRAEALILPGVGSFRMAMEALEAKGLSDEISQAVIVKKRKILGICLGMQLFAESSTEDGYCFGLGLIPGKIERFGVAELRGLKAPHVGFNRVVSTQGSILFNGLPNEVDFYFVHSYRLLNEALAGKVGMCNYGEDFVATYEHDNIFATQFHPEKSQTNGLRLIKNFLLA